MLNQLLSESRLLTILYENLAPEISKSTLYNKVAVYLENYMATNRIVAEDAISIYTDYITSYNKHCKQFLKTGKYPFENNEKSIEISREHYDVVLLLSVLFTPHRFRIMQNLERMNSTGKALYIGLGPGLELKLTKDNYSEIHAYELSANQFLYQEFPDVLIREEYYTGQYNNYFDSIYMIELLEHLDDPYFLLNTCCNSLRTGGKIFLTTATDIPQFDHFYNFPKDHTLFENKLMQLGMKVLFKEEIEHNYLTMNFSPSNHFYVIEKK